MTNARFKCCIILPLSLKTVVFASREITLSKYVKIYIDTYVTKLMSLDRYLNLVL
jgi:hypothetical protein